MLRIRLLGTPEIEGRQDSAAPNIVTKPKRFALLAYLVAWIVMPLEPSAPLVLPPGEPHAPHADASTGPVEKP